MLCRQYAKRPIISVRVKGGGEIFHCRRCGGALLAGAISHDGPVTELYPGAGEELESSIPQRARDYFEQVEIASMRLPGQ